MAAAKNARANTCVGIAGITTQAQKVLRKLEPQQPQNGYWRKLAISDKAGSSDMLAIAGGIIIAVLVLAYLDVILTFAILAAMAIGAVLLLVLLYQFSPGLAGLLGIVAFFVIAYITDSDAPKTAPNLAVKPNQQKHWIVQISGAGAVSEIPIEKAPKTEEVMKLWVNGIVWHNLGVCHETLEAAESFARRRNE